jgi:hypothetical protein
MQWHTSHLTETDPSYLKFVYNHELVVTRDEVPHILSAYGWDSACVADPIAVRVQVDGGEWKETNMLRVHLNSSAILNPATDNPGTWSWSGCTISGGDPEITVSLEESCVASCTFANECGATSTASLFITGECTPTTIVPYIVLPDNLWLDTTSVTIEPGTPIEFVPQPSNGGSWTWTGAGFEDSTRRISLIPYDSVTYTVTHINECGAESSLDFTILMADHTGMSPTIQFESIRIYPTISSGIIHVTIGQLVGEHATLVEVFALDGRPLISKTMEGTSFPVDISFLESGTYLIRVINGTQLRKQLIVRY